LVAALLSRYLEIKSTPSIFHPTIPLVLPMFDMPPDIPTEPSPTRYLLVFRRARFDKDTRTDTQIVQEFAERRKLANVVHLGTTKTDRRVHIVFDDSNPDHCTCPVRAFKGKRQKPIELGKSLTEYLHGRVQQWKDDDVRLRAAPRDYTVDSWPVRSEIFPVRFFAHDILTASC